MSDDVDTDGDGIPDDQDPDADGDGILDSQEYHGLGGTDRIQLPDGSWGSVTRDFANNVVITRDSGEIYTQMPGPGGSLQYVDDNRNVAFTQREVGGERTWQDAHGNIVVAHEGPGGVSYSGDLGSFDMGGSGSETGSSGRSLSPQGSGASSTTGNYSQATSAGTNNSSRPFMKNRLLSKVLGCIVPVSIALIFTCMCLFSVLYWMLN